MANHVEYEKKYFYFFIKTEFLSKYGKNNEDYIDIWEEYEEKRDAI